VSQAAIDIHRPEAQLSRTVLELKQLATVWGRSAKGRSYVEALLTFLNRKQNHNTQRAYAFGLLEFFGWYELKKGRTPLPEEVRRVDAYAFSDYLQKRDIGLDEQRLAQDPDHALDLAIYRYVKGHPSARISAIRKKLVADHRFTQTVEFEAGGRKQSLRVLSIEADDLRGDALAAYVAKHGFAPPDPLDERLACMVDHNLLRRTPTIRRVRSGDAGLGLEHPSRAQLDFRVDPEVFSYFVDVHTTASGAERANSVVTRLSALASFWTYLITESAENAAGSEPLLKHNIWTEPRAQLMGAAKSRSRASRELKTPSRELFLRVLATTFVRSHEGQELQAASAFLEGADVSGSSSGEAGIYDLRDRALMVFAYWTGARAEEMRSLSRDAVQPDGLVTVLGKGDKTRSFAVPPPALRAISDFQAELDARSEGSSDPNALVHKLTASAAPLFPPLKLWGHNRGAQLVGLSADSFSKMMRHRGLRAGVGRQSAEWKKLHAHGVRHLAALEARQRGVDLATIQGTLGHSSLSTTGIYIEVRDPLKRSLMPARSAPGGAPPFQRRAPGHEHPEAEEVIEEIEIDEEPGLVGVGGQPEVPPGLYEEDEEAGDEPFPLDEEEEEAPEEDALTLVHRDAEELVAETDAVEKLLQVYRSNWGETGKRAKLVDAKGLLGSTYAGRPTGLPWWQGAAGAMNASYSYVPNEAETTKFPAMPVIGPQQFVMEAGWGEEDCDEPLCQALGELYSQWLQDPERGPTAAAALTEWIFTSAMVTLEVDAVVRERSGHWVAFDSPLEDTKSGQGKPRVLREHLNDAVVSWFERTAWQFRRSADSATARGSELTVPAWYSKKDPLLDIPAPERAELIDWLQVFVGLPPLDKTPRFDHGASRAKVGKLLGTLCAYDTLATDPDRTRKREQKEILSAVEDQITADVKRATKGRVADFRYGDTKKRRKIETVQAEMAREKSKREGSEEAAEASTKYSKYLATHLMEVVGEVFGKKAAEDPILSLYALCTAGAPLKSRADKYKPLFRAGGGTIEHTPEFAEQFAQETGTHSECVARRLARHIYEEGRAPKWYKLRNWPRDVIPYLESLSAYRVPCPSSQEHELRKRLKSEEPLPVYRRWREASQRLLGTSVPESTEVEEMFAEEAGRGAPIQAFRPRDAEDYETRQVSSEESAGGPGVVVRRRLATPNGMQLLPLLFAMKRARG